MIPSFTTEDLLVDSQPLAGREMYHVGMVVPDIRAACLRHTRLFGARWAPLRHRNLTVVVDGERREVELEISYSVDGPTHVELIQEISGSVWGADGLLLNHVGFYTDDLRRSMRQLEEAGLPSRVHDAAADGGAEVFSYHQDPSGFWVELVHSSFRDNLRAWIDASVGGRPDPGALDGATPY